MNNKFVFSSIKPHCIIEDNKKRWVFNLDDESTSSLLVLCVIFNFKIKDFLNIINQYNVHCLEGDYCIFGKYYFDTKEDAQNALNTLLILKNFSGD